MSFVKTFPVYVLCVFLVSCSSEESLRSDKRVRQQIQELSSNSYFMTLEKIRSKSVKICPKRDKNGCILDSKYWDEMLTLEQEAYGFMKKYNQLVRLFLMLEYPTRNDYSQFEKIRTGTGTLGYLRMWKTLFRPDFYQGRSKALKERFLLRVRGNSEYLPFPIHAAIHSLIAKMALREKIVSAPQPEKAMETLKSHKLKTSDCWNKQSLWEQPRMNKVKYLSWMFRPDLFQKKMMKSHICAQGLTEEVRQIFHSI